ncbi:hypothetical protein GOP47_0025742 [Adiantum capillus-veneris]|uniref:Methyltransferase n=1 Tax=Adiantum capillus-veneris TaxID=13818 RepID=A0A9D4Z2F7_ADICA|nr:hypothetical protein GOP47_0025742 [Adiantum capillus-veneris]
MVKTLELERSLGEAATTTMSGKDVELKDDIESAIDNNGHAMILPDMSSVLADAPPVEAAGCMEENNKRISVHTQEVKIIKVEGIADVGGADRRECNLMMPRLTCSSSQDEPKHLPSTTNICVSVEAPSVEAAVLEKNQSAKTSHGEKAIAAGPFTSFLKPMMKTMEEKFKKSLGTERRRALHEAAMVEFRGHGPDPSPYWIPCKVLQMLSDLQIYEGSSFNPLFDHLWHEIGSGRGYWAGLLKKLGANVVAVDNFTEKHSLSLYFPDTVHMDGEEFIKQGGAHGRALLFCWPRKDDPLHQFSSANARGHHARQRHA